MQKEREKVLKALNELTEDEAKEVLKMLIKWMEEGMMDGKK